MLHVPTWAREKIRQGIITTAKQGIKALRKQYGLSTDPAERQYRFMAACSAVWTNAKAFCGLRTKHILRALRH